jgi:hypothetical protein
MSVIERPIAVAASSKFPDVNFFLGTLATVEA